MRQTGDEYRMRMRPILFIALAATTALALSACGGGTKTVSVSSAVGAGARGPTGVAGTARKPAGPTVTTPPKQSTAPQTTRTATAPAFTKEAAGGEGLSQAVAVVKAHGYTPEDTAEYHADQTLRVLVAARTGSADGHAH